jgi:tRNA G37 N-methylase Trm5
MVMPVRYTDEMVAEAVRLRKAGTKWAVIDAKYGEGIRMAVKRVEARERKRLSRASVAGRIELPLPPGTHAALERVCLAADDAPVALLSHMVHVLDALREAAPEQFKLLTAYHTDVSTVVQRYLHLIGEDDNA